MEYIVKADSWTIIRDDLFAKKGDKSFYDYNSSGIPKEIKQFWNIENLKHGDQRIITLSFCGKNYEAKISIDQMERARIMWSSDLGEAINNEVPRYGIFPQVLFKRIDDKHYLIGLVPDSIPDLLSTEGADWLNAFLGDDNWWPSLEEYTPGLSVQEWVDLLNDTSVFSDNYLAIVKRMKDIGGYASCSQLSRKYGESKNFYNSGSSTLAERIAIKTGCSKAWKDKTSSRWWPILYQGRRARKGEIGSYIYKLRKELSEAIERVNLDRIPLYVKEDRADMEDKFTKNMILYGPPGTGKTYNSIIYAVAIVENKDLDEVEFEAKEDYEAVKKRYEEYKSGKQIGFVTFHQSYGYEEFIEGIRPVVQKDEQNKAGLEYTIKPGIFKEFCDRAARNEGQGLTDYGLNESATVWKISLEGAGENETRRECLENNHIRVGWDEYGAEITKDTDFYFGGKAPLNSFVYKMKPGDIVLSCYNKTQIDAIGVITGDYEWSGEYGYYNRLRKVNWLIKDIREDIVELNDDHVLTLSTVYELKIDPNDILSIVKKYKDNSRYVFIIDEINRGNLFDIDERVFDDGQSSDESVVAPTLDISSIDLGGVLTPHSAMTKIDQWERKLLDFSMHNHLLNIRASGSLVPLLVKDLPKLEDLLADEQEFELVKRPEDWDRHNISTGTFETFNDLHDYSEGLKQFVLLNTITTQIQIFR